MITQTILYVITAPLLLLLDLLPSVSVSIPSGVFDSMDGMFSMLGFIFPMTSLCLIIGIKLTLRVAKIMVAVVVRIKSFIPTMGA